MAARLQYFLNASQSLFIVMLADFTVSLLKILLAIEVVDLV